MKHILPNLDPKIYNISSVLIGFALIDNFTAAEQNALGNWFMTIGQILENNAAWQTMIENRIQGNNININSSNFKKTGNPYNNEKEWIESPNTKELNQIKKTIEIMKEQIKKLTK